MNEVSSVAAPAASKPFKLRIDPSKAVAHEGWSAARAQAIAALKTDRKTALLLGPPGVGKTLMLATIAQDLEQRGCRVHLFTKDVPPPGTFEGDGHVMLVDDARRLGDAVLRELLSAPGLCCLLADQPSLEADITRLSPAPLPAPRVIRLAPLSPGQSRRFVAAQVAQSGRSADLLQRDAIELLVAAAGGIPRAICTIGSRAVYLADVHNEDQVGVSHIEKALSLLPPSAIQSATEGSAPAQDAAAEDTTPYALADGAEASAAVPAPEASPKRDGFPFFPIAIGTALVCGALVVVLGRPTQPAHAPVAEAASSPVPAAPIAAASNVRQPQPPAPVLAAEAPHPAAPAEPAALPPASPGGEATAVPAAALVSAPIGASIGAPAATLPSLPVYPPAPNAEPAAAALPERRGAEQTAFVAAPPLPTPPHAALPDMVELPGNTFTMGSANDPSEGPAHSVAVSRFQIARHAVTVGEWQPCLDAKACTLKPEGPPDAPVTNASYTDAQQFVTWLSGATGETYRLPTEAEWEYAARGGTKTRYAWGNTIVPGKTGCKTCGPAGAHGPAPVTAYPPNAFGLYAMGGGVAEWVSDCWHRDYHGAPTTASAPWDMQACTRHVLRGGSWMDEPEEVAAASRSSYDASVRYPSHGFRLAKSP